jgi:hypothetical protein
MAFSVSGKPITIVSVFSQVDPLIDLTLYQGAAIDDMDVCDTIV